MTADLMSVATGRRAGVALDFITTSRQKWERENRRPKTLTAREALAALQFEALLVGAAAAAVRNGAVLSDDDFDRLAVSVRWIDAIVKEVG